ncbi:MAG: DUF1552 domain-containing protein [Planctomycetota bacterium]|nr:DUF1552 domain-containing protein [Planctomycetota bacterium]
MANIVLRRHLSRRAFLAGTGAALALPWLDAMTPAFAGPSKRPTRSVFVFAPNGAKMDDWLPSGGHVSSKTLAALAPHKKNVTLLEGFAVDGARAHGDGPGDHARCASAFLTCAHPKKTGGADIHVGISIDQVIASHIGGETRFASLELGLEPGRAAGVCDSGYSCAYSNNISWRTPNLPNTKETRPRAVFERLFGDPDAVGNELERKRRREEQKSILDAVLEDAKRLKGKLGKTDARKLAEYLDAVRALETRLEKSEAEVPIPEMPEGLLTDRSYPGRVRLMYDLIVLAFRADLTRTVTLMLGNGGSNISYLHIGVPDGHHNISHHGKEAEKLAKIQRIDQWHVEQLARFLGALDAADDGGKSLLHRSQVLYGSAIGDGNRHNHDNLPLLLAGRGNGKLKSGRRLKGGGNTPLAEAYLGMLKVLGIREKTFGDGTKALF